MTKFLRGKTAKVSAAAILALTLEFTTHPSNAQTRCTVETTNRNGELGYVNRCNQSIWFAYCSYDDGPFSCRRNRWGEHFLGSGDFFTPSTAGGEIRWAECYGGRMYNRETHRCN